MTEERHPPRGAVRLLPLFDCPHFLPTIARWHFEEWGRRTAGATIETAEERLRAFFDRDDGPRMLVAVDDELVVGTAALRRFEMGPDPEREYWLGSVYVEASRRGSGLGRILVEGVIRRAAECGVRTLHLQTERKDGGLYARLGWTPLEEVTRPDGLEVLVMQRTIVPFSP